MDTRSTARDFGFSSCTLAAIGDSTWVDLGAAGRMTLEGGGGGVKRGVFEPLPPTKVAYALLDMGGNSDGATGIEFFVLEKSQKRDLVWLLAGLDTSGSTEAVDINDALMSSDPASSTMSSKFRNVNAASRLESLTGFRGGRDILGAPTSNVGRNDSGAGAVIG